MTDSQTVLIVDDDPQVREMLVDYLSAQGFAMLSAADGKAARELLDGIVPNLVILDINMPGEDGLSLARYLREHHELGIIMVTASGEVVDRIVGLEIGADDYVAKPFDLRELLARVRSVLRRTRQSPMLVDPSKPRTIRTVRGDGYMFVPSPPVGSQ